MATVRISTGLLVDLLFKGLDVRIDDARTPVGRRDELELTLSGPDVPDCKEARVVCHVHEEPGCDRWVRVQILPFEERRHG